MKHVLLIVMLTFSTPSFAQTSDAETELRAREVGRQLRCVVCQNQSIEDSDASLAEDMRRLVRARIEAGDSNEDVIYFMQERYGDFVLLKPPVQRNTLVLWFAPLAAVLGGLIWFLVSRRKSAGKVMPLSEEERAALDKILRGGRS